jgi:Ricin-type beta-trefoil lectin domain
VTEPHNDPDDRLRVGGWLPSRNDSTATQQIPAVQAAQSAPPETGPEPAFAAPPSLVPVQVERQRRGRWWFLVAPAAVVVLVVAVAVQFRPDGAAIGPELAQQSPQVALPVLSASARTNEEPSTSPSASALPTASASSSAAARGATPSAATSTAPAGHRGAVVGIGGRCLAADRDRPELAVCDDRSSQRWSAPGDGTVRVVNRCLDVFASGEANGTPVILYQCNRTDAQQWQLRGDGSWRNPQSNKCLSAVGGRSDPGTRLAVFDCTGAASQKWTLL